ncbi:MAG: RloB domain-containing protein [Candidatus Aminicenantes bacterium]|nr:MAG: RloB domain-containing protein [Candidatus Aminicenantes bacterium]
MKRQIKLKQRREHIRKERKIFLIICEGRKTERFYFKEFRTRNNNIRIEVPNCSYTDPLNLAQFAIKMKSTYDIDLKRGDRIWCVFDVNCNKDEMIKNAKKEADKNKIEVILSNPCFELWYLLHFEFSTAYISTEQAVKKLEEKYIPNYQKNQFYFDQLKPHLSKAVENAQRLNRFHEGNQTPLFSTESNPSTQVFRLAAVLPVS